MGLFSLGQGGQAFKGIKYFSPREAKNSCSTFVDPLENLTSNATKMSVILYLRTIYLQMSALRPSLSDVSLN